MLFEGVGFVFDLPHSQVLGSCSHDVLPLSVNIWNPHNFGGWEFMLELVNLLEPIIWLVKLQVNDINLVVHAVDVITTHSHDELVIFSVSKRN